MTDLLTKEEREEVEGVRHRWQHERSDSVDTGKLFAVIDNLSKRGVKKYTPQEWVKLFDTVCNHPDGLHALSAWIRAGNFLGALEEKCQT